METQTQVQQVKVEITVLLGRSRLPMHQLLRMGRGSQIQLDQGEHDPVWILANGHPIARGEITVIGDRVTVMVIDKADVHEFYAVG